MANEKSWEKTFRNFVDSWQTELKKTTAIGKKMLTASRINSSLSDTYQQLGKLAYKELSSQKLQWENEKAQKYCKKIDLYLEDLEKAETEVGSIKKSKDK